MSCLPYTLGRWFLSSGLHDLSVSEALLIAEAMFYQNRHNSRPARR